MNAFTLYLILQLDTILVTVNAFALVFGLAGIGLVMLGYVAVLDSEHEQEMKKAAKEFLRPAGILFLFTLLLATLLPTTKNACAIAVVPQLLESKLVQQDLPEVYNLAVEAVKAAIGGAK